jgi:hypothetical protein
MMMLFDSETGAVAGRIHTLFRPEFTFVAGKLAQLGATEREIAEILGVAPATVSKWKLTHEDFAEALKVGKEPADERVVRSLYQRAIGFHYTEQRAVKVKTGPNEERIELVEIERYAPPETGACALWLKSRRPTEWRDKVEHELTSREDDRLLASITVDRVVDHLKTLDDAC